MIIDELRLAADGDGASSFEDTEHTAFTASRPARLPVLEGSDELGGSCVALANLDPDSTLPHGVVQLRRGDRGGDTGGEVQSDQTC